MPMTPTIKAAWRDLWTLSRRHASPAWAQLLLAAIGGVLLALGLLSLLAGVGTFNVPNWFQASLLPTILICACISCTLLATVRLAERLLPAALLEAMACGRGILPALLLACIAVTGVILGMWLGFTLVFYLFRFNVWGMFASLPAPLMKFALFLFAIFWVNWAWWRTRMRNATLRQEATEANLRLLQAQIEPHFLFNTLANVQSLMDYDPPRAKAMLEAFSDYLRASLGQLRETDSTLGAELGMAEAYLELLQIRMEERLTFSIEAGPEARAVRLPTLLLQPLVENAIHHGLEPKIEGGHVRISATIAEGRLQVHVDDDGMGLDAPRRTLRAGAGMAVDNLRTRLATRYGADASLALATLAAGTRASLDLPAAS